MDNKPPEDDAVVKPVSEARIQANQRNAQKSSGPRTTAGKARSRLNALKHGAYAAVAQVIAFGPFGEDDDEIVNFVDALIDALDPRDVIEHESGRKIAKIALSERRLDRYETALLQADGQSTPDAQTVIAPAPRTTRWTRSSSRPWTPGTRPAPAQRRPRTQSARRPRRPATPSARKRHRVSQTTCSI